MDTQSTAFVVTVSTGCARGEREDRSGPAAAERLAKLGLTITGHTVVPDDRLRIAQQVIQHADFVPVSLLFLTGGTGPTPDDVTPQAVTALLHRRFEGVETAIHNHGRSKLGTAPLARVLVGARCQSLIVCAPGSTGGVDDVIDTLTPMLSHLLKLMRGAPSQH